MKFLVKEQFIKYCYRQVLLLSLVGLVLSQGCTAVATFPTIARAGDTVSVMVGGTENARKETISVILTDVNGLDWDLQALGLIRSVFNLRADARSQGTHYSTYLETYFSWSAGHDPVQTVLLVNLPVDVPVGAAYLTVNPLVNDDSSGISVPFIINIDVIAGAGSSDIFLRQDASGPLAADLTRFEPAPHAKLSFGITDGITIGAASIVIDFDETIVTAGDINVFASESTVRGSVVSTGSFGKTQRMIYWHQDGLQMFIDIIAPQGINQAFLKVYLVHPNVLSASPNFNIISSKIYDVNGVEIALTPTLEYFP